MVLEKMKRISVSDLPRIRPHKTLVTTNGTFDILHVAHLRVLQEAKKKGDILLVLVNDDHSVKLNKGPSRPILPLEERLEMLSALACVDYVMSFSEKDVKTILAQIRPDIHIKGGSFVPERIREEKSLVESWGGKHICLEMIGNYSTTNIIEKIKKLERD